MARLQKWGNEGLWAQLPCRRPLSAQGLQQRSHHLEKVWERGIGLFPFHPHSGRDPRAHSAPRGWVSALWFLGKQHLWAAPTPPGVLGGLWGGFLKEKAKSEGLRGGSVVQHLGFSGETPPDVWLTFFGWEGPGVVCLPGESLSREHLWSRAGGEKSLQRANSNQTLLETVTSWESSLL